METLFGVAALLAGIGVLYFTRTGREGMRIQRMEDEHRQQMLRERP
jgi:hypothetical protein